MKKVWVFISLLFFSIGLFSGFNSIKADAASLKYVKVSSDKDKTLLRGGEFNSAIRVMASGKALSPGYQASEADTIIKSIKFMSKTESMTDSKTNLVQYLKSAGVSDFTSTYAVLEGDRLYVINTSSPIVFNSKATNMFAELRVLENIDFGNNVDASAVTEMVQFFHYCEKLKTIKWGSFMPKKVQSFVNCFCNCESLQTLALPRFDTSATTDMAHMFSSCRSLESLDLSWFNTSNVTDFGSMFSGCSSLKTLKIANFDYSSARAIRNMFDGCRSLEELNIPYFNPKYATEYIATFRSVGADTGLTLTLNNCDARKITTCNWFFYGIKNLDISGLSLSGVTTVNDFFGYSLKSIKTPKKMPKRTKIRLNGYFYKSNDNGKTLIKDKAYIYLDSETPTGTWLYRDIQEESPDYDDNDSALNDDYSDDENFDESEGKSASDKVAAVPVTVGSEFTDGTETYRVTSANTIELVKSITKSKKVSISAEKNYGGQKFSVTSIGKDAFKKNKKIKSMTIPKSITTIDSGAFRDCKKLKKISVESASLSSVGKNAFKGISKDACFTIRSANKKTAKKLSKMIVKKGGAKNAIFKIKK